MADLFKINQSEVSRELFDYLRVRLEFLGGSVEKLVSDQQFSLKEITDQIDRFTGANGKFELSDISLLREKIGHGAFTDFLDFLGSHNINLYGEAADLGPILLAGRLAEIPEAFWEDRAFIMAGVSYSAEVYCRAAPDIQLDFEIAGVASAINRTTLECMPNWVGLAIGKMEIPPIPTDSKKVPEKPAVRRPKPAPKPQSAAVPPAPIAKKPLPTFPTPH